VVPSARRPIDEIWRRRSAANPDHSLKHLPTSQHGPPDVERQI
jgi:hypothetical protein